MIHIISRHCHISNLSLNKPRPAFFSREKCLQNLISVTNNKEHVKIHYLFDGSPDNLKNHYLSKYITNITYLNSGTGAKSFLDALAYAKQLKCNQEDIIYFIEDDYLHTTNWDELLLEGFSISDNIWISLYDHGDKYVQHLSKEIRPMYKMYENYTSKITYVNNTYWRTAISTTDTFAIKYKDIITYEKVLTHFSSMAHHSLDHDRGIYLNNQGFGLWTPMPGASTHMEIHYMSPIINWEMLQKITTW
jgi:hypothetical protein